MLGVVTIGINQYHQKLSSHDYTAGLGSTAGSTSVCIVIPTYNEAENIIDLLGMIYSKKSCTLYSSNNILMYALVVDDNSPDGTASVVREFREANPNVHLLLRNEKNGLGAAYIAGMQHAMQTLKPDIIFEMDADLSHHPKYIVPMILEILNGADFVIGSRYTAGGSVPKDWGILRKLISSTANTYSRVMLGIFYIKDCTGGFRAIKTSVLQKIDLNSLGARGYVFQISLLNAILQMNSVVEELPIHFRDRTLGKSKMQIKDIAEVGTMVLKLSLHKMLASIPSAFETEDIARNEDGSARRELIKT